MQELAHMDDARDAAASARRAAAQPHVLVIKVAQNSCSVHWSVPLKAVEEPSSQAARWAKTYQCGRSECLLMGAKERSAWTRKWALWHDTNNRTRHIEMVLRGAARVCAPRGNVAHVQRRVWDDGEVLHMEASAEFEDTPAFVLDGAEPKLEAMLQRARDENGSLFLHLCAAVVVKDQRS